MVGFGIYSEVGTYLYVANFEQDAQTLCFLRYFVLFYYFSSMSIDNGLWLDGLTKVVDTCGSITCW